jgi:hypothetical protein
VAYAAHRSAERFPGPCLLPPSLLTAMLGDDEDVFDSVTWETPGPAAHTPAPPSGLSGGFGAGFDDDGAGPGFRQSTDDDGRDPHEPKWEGFLKTAVRDPTKELAETKDAYVSYLVAAEVCVCVGIVRTLMLTPHRRTSRSTRTRAQAHGEGTRTLCSYGII